MSANALSATSGKWRVLWALAAAGLLGAVGCAGAAESGAAGPGAVPAASQPTQGTSSTPWLEKPPVTAPPKPSASPIPLAPSHMGVAKFKLGEGAAGIWIFTPTGPTPSVAPLILFLHGYRATDPVDYGGWIEHIVRQGNIVLYPIFEGGVRDPEQEIIDNLINSTRGAITYLQRSGPVRPDLNRFAIVGHSFGGGLSAVVASLAQRSGLPIPKAIMPVQPGWRGGGDYPAEDLPGVPSSVLILVVEGDQDQFADSRKGQLILSDTSRVPASQKCRVILQTDKYGNPPLLADHYAPLSPDQNYELEVKTRSKERRERMVKWAMDIRSGEEDALDFYGFWKLFDVLSDKAFAGERSISKIIDAAGGTSMGTWPDGTPVKPKIIRCPEWAP